MIAVRIYKNIENKSVLGYTIVDEDTLEKRDIYVGDLKQIYRLRGQVVSNLEIDAYGRMRFRDMNPDVKIKWYDRTMIDGVMIEHYIVITEVRQGLVGFIADKRDGNILNGVATTLSDMASALRVPVDRLKFFNAYISKDEINKTVLNVYDTRINKYKAITEKCFDDDIYNRIYRKMSIDWDVEIADVNTNGVHVASIGKKKPSYEATLPEQIYMMESFEGGVNHLKLPVSLRTIGERCFSELDDLYSIEINDGLRVIPRYAFSESGLERVRFGLNVEEIQEYAFCECYNLKGPIVVGAKIIGHKAFCDTKISIVNLDGTEEIGVEAFADNPKLRTLKLRDGLREIGGGAFRWCTGLEEVRIPSTIEKIGRKAFAECKKLKTVYLPFGISRAKVASDSFEKNVEFKYYN